MRENNVDFFGNNKWAGNSPDLNSTENLGAIIKDRVERELHRPDSRRSATLRNILEEVLNELKDNTHLFQRLLKSFPQHLEAVRNANGGHTKI
jgi:hypothetical protein